MTELTMDNLEIAINNADEEYIFFGVLIQHDNIKELIVNPTTGNTMKFKLAEYKANYNHDLTHKEYPNTKIIGFSQADSLEELEGHLMSDL